MTRKLKVLDLCSGMNGWTAAYRERGHECVGLELDPRFKPEMCMDVRHLATDPEALLDALVRPGWRPDVILASPPCEGFSVASIGKMWEKDEATGSLGKPKHPTSIYGLDVLNNVLQVIAKLQPEHFWIENPRGGMRKMPQMQAFRRVTVWQCRYGETRAKPTDLFGRWPSGWAPRPECHNGNPDHESAPRGAKTGTQGVRGSALRALVPYALSLETCLAVEEKMLTEEQREPCTT